MQKKIFFLGIILLVLGGFLVIFFAEYCIKIAYKDTPHHFLHDVIAVFYPRFLTEKHRFLPEFFLQKIQQIGFRMIFLGILGGIFLFFFRQIISFFKPQQISKKQILYYQRYFTIFLLWCVWDWGFILYQLSELPLFYNPVFLLRFFGKTNFSFFWLICIYFLLIFSILFVFFDKKPVFFSVIIFCTFIFLQGYLYSFHKIDHTFAPVNMVCFVFIFLLSEKPKTKENIVFSTYFLLCIQLCIASCYTFAGIEKLLIGGTNWLIDAPLQYYLLGAEVPLGVWLAQSHTLCWLLGFGVLCWELGFVFAVFSKKILPFFVLIGFLFHLGTYFLMNVGGFPHTWVCLYVFFFTPPKMRLWHQ